MDERELEEQEDRLPILAIEALEAAQARARASGRSIVLLEGRDLVRVGPDGTTVLQTLPARVKVTNRKKRATQ